MPTAATSSGPTSLSVVHGNDGVGKPCGSEPTVATPVDGEVEHGRDDRGAGDRDEHRGDLRGDAREHEQHDEHGDADRERRRRRVSSRCSNERAHLVDEAVGVGREPEELRQLADDDRDRQPVHVADLHLAREQVGDEAELAEAEADLDERRRAAPACRRARSPSPGRRRPRAAA